LANELVDTLEKDDELHDAAKLAQSIHSSLGDAESCETESDFDANVKEASKDAKALGDALKKARTRAKRDDLPETLEAITDAQDSLRALVREIGTLLPE